MLPSTAERVRLHLTGPQAVTETSAVLWRPVEDRGRPGLVLGHGAGTDLTNAVLCAAGRGLAARGHPVLTFNFAYAEAGRKRPDPAPRLQSAFRDAVAHARAAMGPDRLVVLGGRSMGGRMATLLAADGEPCDGLVLLGYPLHPAGRPERLRTEHWPRLRQPVLFVQGDRDRLCELDLLGRERAEHLGQVDSRLHVVVGGDHGFAVPRMASDGRGERSSATPDGAPVAPPKPSEVLDEVVGVIGGWLAWLAPTTAGAVA